MKTRNRQDNEAVQIGQKLHNTGIVIGIEGNDREGYVLCILPDNFMAYCHWHYFMQENGVLETSSGHYVPELDRAVESFLIRAGVREGIF